MPKSYVTLEQHICPVCGQPHDTGALLLDRRLRERFAQHTVTDWSLCPEHARLAADGYIALVGIDAARSPTAPTPATAYRTGTIAHVRRSAWTSIFNIPAPDGPIAFTSEETFSHLQELAK